MYAFTEIFKQLLAQCQGKRMVIIGHVKPDGDCIGSQVALCRILNSQGIDAVCLNASPVPSNLQTFVGGTPFYTLSALKNKENEEKTAGEDKDNIKTNIETLQSIQTRTPIFVDCANGARAGSDVAALFPQHTALGMVDHHISNTDENFGTHRLLDLESPATCEVLARCINSAALPIDATTATALYLGIYTDVGAFAYGLIRPETFEACAELMRAGAEIQRVNFKVYRDVSAQKMALQQRYLASLQTDHTGRVCLGVLSAEDFKATGTTPEDAENLVDLAMQRGVEIYGMLREATEYGASGKSDASSENETVTSFKGSWRSRAQHIEGLGIEIETLASKLGQRWNGGGGGHAMAAGYNFPAPQGETLATLQAACLEAAAQHIAANT